MKLLVTTQIVDVEDPILGFFHGWLLEFARHFERIDVICLKEGAHHLPSHVYVHSLGKEHGEVRIKYLLRFYRYFVHVFFTVRVDYVFYHMGAINNILGAPFFLLRRIFKTKFFWWKTHGHIDMWGRLAGRLVDRVYTASDGSFPLPYQHKSVVGHGIPISGDIFLPRNFSNPLSLIVVGRVSPVKHVDVAIDVARLLKERKIPFTMQFIGAVIDARYMDAMKEFVFKCGLTDVVSFLGPVPPRALMELYLKSDFLVHPSTTGGIDKVVLEAMSMGVFPIALEQTYGSIIPHVCGVPLLEPRFFVDALEKMWRMSVLDREDMQKEMRALIIKNHSLSTLTGRIFGTHGRISESTVI